MDAPKPDREAIARQLERILAGPEFDASRRCRALLRFLVEEMLAGRESLLTDRTIGAQVFGRPEGFDPVLDPIVRLQVGRLRRSLARYYGRAGAGEPVRIELPQGTYVPVGRTNDARLRGTGTSGCSPRPLVNCAMARS
jgi:hypothetical protein